jgi:CRISPR/Cas system-associated exonuclease Cas4 (RecB family)
LAGDQEEKLPPHVQRKLQRGTKSEEWAKAKLLHDFGRRIQNFERTLEIEKGYISGRVDACYLVDPDDHRTKNLPIEIKSTTMYDRMLDVEDLLGSKWTRKWVYQLTSYMIAMKVEGGIMMLIHPEKYSYRYIPVPYDETIGNEIIDKGMAIQKHLAEHTLPPQIQDPHECIDCGLRHVCCPDISFNASLAMLNNASELENDINRMLALKAQLKEPNAEFNKLEKKVKESLNLLFDQNPAVKEFALENMVVSFKPGSRKGFYQQPSSWRNFKYA